MTGRPDPDQLLARVQAEEAQGTRGRLKLFFGAVPGVGKTFTMLEAAQARRRDGVGVLVGIVETHGRADTARLLDGLPILPRRSLEYRGAVFQEFDLDAALDRRPTLLLLDELAHTNAVGSRHDKRWQDVNELLDAGIDVWSTLNVQHVDSLNDVVAQITGITVRETVPDAMLELADEIELVDVSPEVLLQRLKEGKVYIPEQAGRALEQFFRRGNIIALRELALRHTARAVDADMRDYRTSQGITEPWPAAERIAVCVGPDAGSARLVRAARRMAEGLNAEWTALYVETPSHARLAAEDQAAAIQNLRLAEQLGARTVTLSGEQIAPEILAWARANNVTKIVVGKPAHARRPFGRETVLDELVRGSGAIDVYVIRGAEATTRRARAPEAFEPGEYGLAAGLVGLVTALGLVARGVLTTTDVAMLYLLAVALVGARARQRPAITAGVLAIAAFDFCFVPPFYTFAISDARYLLTFGMMLGIAVAMARLTGRIREQVEQARSREQRTAALLALSRDVAAERAPEEILNAMARHIREAFASSVTVILPGKEGVFPEQDGVARWVFERRQLAGLGTQTLPATPALYLPLEASDVALGVVRIEPRDPRDARDPVRRQLLESFVRQGAVALARAQLAERHEKSQVEVRTERLRNSLLSSLSHDLRTPLATIEGAASTLLSAPGVAESGERRAMAESILAESRRMTRLVANLLDMVRLEAGALHAAKEWQPLQEVVGVALVLMEERLRGFEVATRLPADLPLVPIDGLLIEQVLINLVENAVKYAPRGTAIEIGAVAEPGAVIVSIADRGPGIPHGEEVRIFEKFHRAVPDDAAGGVGLGLTISQGIVTAHGGRMWAENREGGGAVIRFTIPLEGTPPPMPQELAVGQGQADA